MLIIKNQKLILLGVFLGLMAITIPISNVVAIPMETSEMPYTFRTLKGIKVSGILSDVQNFDQDYAHWKGEFVFSWKHMIYVWIVEPALYYDHPGYTYKYVSLKVRFQYSGKSDLTIYVWYREGGNDHFDEPSTGGNFVTKYYTLENYKTVSYISFYDLQNAMTGYQQHVYIDCARVDYCSI